MSDYGDATITRLTGGRLVVERADDVIAISLELLAAAGNELPVDESGCILLAADPRYRYRPVRFVGRQDDATETARMLVCERVQ